MRIYLLIAVLLLAGSAHAATLTVCSSGCDYSSIQAAIDAANIGDTIKVQGGTYNEDVVINKDVQLTYLGAVSVNNLFTCGHKIQGGSIIAGFFSDSCNPEAFKGHISNNKATIGSGPTPEVMNKVMKLREAAKSRITNKSLVPLIPGQNNSTVTGTLLYSDDFSDNQSGWAITDGQTGYKSGKYQVVAQDDRLTYGGIGKSFTDFAIEVEATLERGSDKSDYGIIFRRVDDANFYRFAITSEGNYKFDKWQNSKWADISPSTHSGAIHTGKATNIIKAECNGDKFTLYVNGIKLGEYADNSFASGNIGLQAGSSEGIVQASFDNLKVWAL